MSSTEIPAPIAAVLADAKATARQLADEGVVTVTTPDEARELTILIFRTLIGTHQALRTIAWDSIRDSITAAA